MITRLLHSGERVALNPRNGQNYSYLEYICGSCAPSAFGSRTPAAGVDGPQEETHGVTREGNRGTDPRAHTAEYETLLTLAGTKEIPSVPPVVLLPGRS